MPHWKSLMDNEYIGAWDLKGRDVTVTIARVSQGELHNQGKKKKDRKPIVYFQGKEKGCVFNTTNCKTVASMYGTDTEQWAGKRITLFPTTTDVGGESKECIRVRPRIPPAAKEQAPESNRDEPPAPEQEAPPSEA